MRSAIIFPQHSAARFQAMTTQNTPAPGQGAVLAVSVNPAHGFSKTTQDAIRLLQGLGVEGDAHCGEKVKHRSRVAQNPDQPNIRQVLHNLLKNAIEAGEALPNLRICVRVRRASVPACGRGVPLRPFRAPCVPTVSRRIA